MISRSRPRDPYDRGDWLPTLVSIPLRGVPRSAVCSQPHRKIPCLCCRRLRQQHGVRVDSLEFLAVASGTEDTPTEQFDFKNWAGMRHPDCGIRSWHGSIAAPLSAYRQTHQNRLLARRPLVSSLPSSAPVMAMALDIAGDRERAALAVDDLGGKVGAWLQQATQEPRGKGVTASSSLADARTLDSSSTRSSADRRRSPVWLSGRQSERAAVSALDRDAA